MTNGTIDPAQQWSDLLVGLSDRRRAAVEAALRSSAQQGWPADREAVRLLVAYAQGEITAQDYAIGIIAAMGAPEGVVQAPPRARVEPSAQQALAVAQQPAPAPVAEPQAPRLTREEAVAAYVSGRIPVEEFLRITRGVSA